MNYPPPPNPLSPPDPSLSLFPHLFLLIFDTYPLMSFSPQTHISRLPPGAVAGQSLAIEGGVCRLVSTADWASWPVVRLQQYFNPKPLPPSLDPPAVISLAVLNRCGWVGGCWLQLTALLQIFPLPLSPSACTVFTSPGPATLALHSHLD